VHFYNDTLNVTIAGTGYYRYDDELPFWATDCFH